MDTNSRYRFCSGIKDEFDVLILTDPEPFVGSFSDDTTVTLTDGDTLTGLAFKFYGSSSLWWVIADYNAISDPTLALDPGARVVVPSRRTVNEDALSEARRASFQA